MEENERKPAVRKPLWAVLLLAVLLCATVFQAVAWFYQSGILAYAPVSSHESLYIGAGHISIINPESANPEFDPDAVKEDVRYLYLEGVDLTDDDKEYFDYVFCVYGNAISQFKLQLAYTTINQFTYEIFNAVESNVNSSGAVPYTIHTEVNHAYPTYYYTTSGVALAGSALNETTALDGKTIADSTKHAATYGTYDDVNRFAEPIYWQTSSSIAGRSRGAFVKYFILRVHKGDKDINDRETDVICIAAKSSS